MLQLNFVFLGAISLLFGVTHAGNASSRRTPPSFDDSYDNAIDANKALADELVIHAGKQFSAHKRIYQNLAKRHNLISAHWLSVKSSDAGAKNQRKNAQEVARLAKNVQHRMEISTNPQGFPDPNVLIGTIDSSEDIKTISMKSGYVEDEESTNRITNARDTAAKIALKWQKRQRDG